MRLAAKASVDLQARIVPLLALILLALAASRSHAGAGCVVAKKMGNSLDIAWIAQTGVTVEQVLVEAEQRLRAKGFGKDRYEGFSPQANTELEHAYVIIVRAEYPNARGRSRVSYGCGFSAVSYHEAEWAALRDLQSYSWGWTPSKGYETTERFQY